MGTTLTVDSLVEEGKPMGTGVVSPQTPEFGFLGNKGVSQQPRGQAKSPGAPGEGGGGTLFP